MKTNYHKLFIAFFIVLLLLPLRFFTVDQKQFEVSFWGRRRFIAAYADLRILLGDRVFKNVIIGKDDWLVFTGERSSDDYQNVIPFSEDELAIFQQELDSFADQLRLEGITLLVVIVPNKNTIYPEYVPTEIPIMGSTSRLDQVIQYMDSHGGTQILDLRPVLITARQDHQIYYAMDTHWNEYGAFAGYQSIMAALQVDFPILIARPLADYEIRSLGEKKPDLAASIGGTILEEEMFELTPLFESQTEARSIAIGDRKITLSSNPGENLPRAVVYHDSFFFKLIPLLTEHFSQAVFIPLGAGGDVMTPAWIDEIKPDIVIIEVTERYIEEMLRFVSQASEWALQR